nr:MAG TPA: hypothetical protein [Caudoviricetes sp.]
MVTISNSQCDQIVRYLKILCECLNENSTSNYNVKRLSRKLIKQLEEKKPK